MKKFVYLTFFLLSFGVSAVDRIAEIAVAGNARTSGAVIRHVSNLYIGQEVTEKVIKDAQDNILSTGVFENVTIQKQLDASGYKIFINVEEKTTWFIVPYFSYSNSSKSGGAAFGEANLFGRLKQFALFGDWGTYMKRAAMGYKDPSLFETDVALIADGLIRHEEHRDYIDNNSVRRVKVKETGFRLLPGYRWSRNFSTYFGAFYRYVKQTLIDENANLRTIDLGDGHDIAALVYFEYNSMKNLYGLQEGSRIELETQISDNRFYSDFNYYRQVMRLYRGFIFRETLNLTGNASIQYGSALPYYREITVGGANLRGFRERQFRGDTRYSAGTEFMFPIYSFQKAIVRGLTFYDTAVIYFKDVKFRRAAWNNGIGGGLRLYMKNIAIPLIGFDMAYGFENEGYETYLNVGASF